jgi:hypothetical protein
MPLVHIVLCLSGRPAAQPNGCCCTAECVHLRPGPAGCSCNCRFAGEPQLATATIPNDTSFVVFSKRGYIKRMGADTFSLQGRNGRGASAAQRHASRINILCLPTVVALGAACNVRLATICTGTKGATLKSDDSMEEVLHVMDHDSVLFFTQVKLLCYMHAARVPLQLPCPCCARALDLADLDESPWCAAAGWRGPQPASAPNTLSIAHGSGQRHHAGSRCIVTHVQSQAVPASVNVADDVADKCLSFTGDSGDLLSLWTCTAFVRTGAAN